MEQAQFEAGLAFFSDPVTFELQTPLYLIQYVDADLRPSILSRETYDELVRRTDDERARLFALQGFPFSQRTFEIAERVQNEGDYFVDQLRAAERDEYRLYEEYSTLQKKLRIARGPQQGNHLPLNTIIDPSNRGLIRDEDKIDATDALLIFVGAARQELAFQNDEAIMELCGNDFYDNQARTALNNYRRGAIVLDPILEQKLAQFGIQRLPAEQQIPQQNRHVQNVVPVPVVNNAVQPEEGDDLIAEMKLIWEAEGFNEDEIEALLEQMGFNAPVMIEPAPVEIDQAAQLAQLEEDLRVARELEEAEIAEEQAWLAEEQQRHLLLQQQHEAARLAAEEQARQDLARRNHFVRGKM